MHTITTVHQRGVWRRGIWQRGSWQRGIWSKRFLFRIRFFFLIDACFQQSYNQFIHIWNVACTNVIKQKQTKWKWDMVESKRKIKIIGLWLKYCTQKQILLNASLEFLSLSNNSSHVYMTKMVIFFFLFYYPQVKKPYPFFLSVSFVNSSFDK